MRRCLRVFLTGLLTLSLLTAPAHACWRSRQARRCRTAPVPACVPACCEPCGAVVVVESCGGGTACCGNMTVSATERVEGQVAAEPAGAAVDSVVEQRPAPSDEPTPAPVAAVDRVPSVLEPISSPPALEPAHAGVTPASNEQPVAEFPFAAAPEPVAEPGAESPAEQPLEAEIAEQELATGPAAGSLDEPLAAEEPARPVPAADQPAEPVFDPAVEEPAPAGVPGEPPAVEAPPSTPAEDGNFFEEVDAQETGAERVDAAAADAAPFDEADAAPAQVADPLGEAGAEPFGQAEPSPENETAPADTSKVADTLADPEPAASEPAAPDEDAAMSDEDAAISEEDAVMSDEDEPPTAEPADPLAGEEPAAEQAQETQDEEEPLDEPADEEPVAADPFVAREPLRRWIDATGTASLVGTLVGVGGDGRCVLETRGQRLVVPLEKLSPHDRDYVREAGIRLAKSRGGEAGDTAAAAVPPPTDTAGL